MYNGGSEPSRWNLKGRTAEVTAITLLPSCWSKDGFEHHGKGAIFILKDCRDLKSANSGGALFPEILKNELRAVRSTIEAYSRTAVLGGAEEASACGLLISGNSGVRLRATMKSGAVMAVRIDRWD
jgi:hypothetical protein